MQEQRFVYDGWNLVAVLAPDSSLLTSFLWGLDLSGSLQGAGGVGGLLFVTQPSTPQPSTHFVAYDGNGNVMALVQATDGTESARYEYGPFGEKIRATGLMATENPLRFSTKFTDDETDLLYYGYRFYNASTGRWLSRDPIAEKGGLNLYGFVWNGTPNFIDKLGLWGCKLGNRRSPKCEITITDSGNNPNQIAAAQGLAVAAEEMGFYMQLFGLAGTFFAGGTLGIEAALMQAAQQLLEETTRPNVQDMVNRALALLARLGAWRGYTPHTRITYQECVCGGLFHLYRNHWQDTRDKWELYDGTSDLGMGTFLDALRAAQAGSEQCKRKLEQWNDANKSVLQ